VQFAAIIVSYFDRGFSNFDVYVVHSTKTRQRRRVYRIFLLGRNFVPSVHVSLYGLLAQKRKSVDKPELSGTFHVAEVADNFWLKVQADGRAALCQRIILWLCLAVLICMAMKQYSMCEW